MLAEKIVVKDEECQLLDESNLVERICDLIEIIYEKIRVSWVGKWINSWYKYMKEHKT